MQNEKKEDQDNLFPKEVLVVKERALLLLKINEALKNQFQADMEELEELNAPALKKLSLEIHKQVKKLDAENRILLQTLKHLDIQIDENQRLIK